MKIKVKFSLGNYSTFVFDQKLFITLVSQINCLCKLYSFVHYEKAY